MINFVFYIKTFENGDTLPLIKSEPPFDELSDLSNGFVGTIDGAIKIIDNIEKVISEEKDSYIFGGSDFVILGVGKDTTTITSFFVVDEKVRSRGIGKMMEEYCVELAMERKCFAIELFSQEKRTDAHRFYERQGYQHFQKFFIKEL